jgi:hypothetical protein
MWPAIVFVALSTYPSLEKPDTPNESSESAAASTPVNGSARIAESKNFHVESYSARYDARVIADRCESIRNCLQLKWLGAESAESWMPRCVVAVHAARASYRAAIGRGGEQSFGSSWIGSQGGRISQRRIDVLIDARGGISALGHELTHLVIADAFPDSRPPTWANEGAAVLADSAEKQRLHKRDLDQSLRRQTAFHCAELMQMADYPGPHRTAAFYGQSASLAAFLAHVGGPEKFIPFLRQANEYGYDHALRESYGIQGVAELQRRWFEHYSSGALPQMVLVHQPSEIGSP